MPAAAPAQERVRDLGLTALLVSLLEVSPSTVPLHPFARSLAAFEAVIGQLFPATLLARLVTLELQGRALVESNLRRQ
jgi:hypothetical protein